MGTPGFPEDCDNCNNIFESYYTGPNDFFSPTGYYNILVQIIFWRYYEYQIDGNFSVHQQSIFDPPISEMTRGMCN